MKKIILLMAILTLASCSKKDDDPEINLKFPSDYLIEGSPWTFKEMEVLNVTRNVDNLTIPEINQIVTDNYAGWKWTFAEANVGSLTLPTGQIVGFNWNFTGNSNGDGIDFSKLKIEGDAAAVFLGDNEIILTDVSVDDTNFIYTISNYGQDDGQGEDVVFDGRFTFN